MQYGKKIRMTSSSGSKKELTDYPVLPCIECKAKCCRYVGVEIGRPTCKRDYDIIRWYLLHKNVTVHIDHDNDWFVEFQTVCEELQPDSGCRRYDKRPQICREHGWPVGSCEFFSNPHQHLFSTISEFESYLDELGTDWRWKRWPRIDKGD